MIYAYLNCGALWCLLMLHAYTPDQTRERFEHIASRTSLPMTLPAVAALFVLLNILLWPAGLASWLARSIDDRD